MMLQVKLFSILLTWTVTWLGFNDAPLKTVENVNTGDNVNDQAPDPPKVDCYQFTNWDGSADNVTSNLVIHAVYEQYKYILSIDSEPEMHNGSIVAVAPYTFDINNQITDLPCSTTVSVTAVPDSGYKLSKWYQNDTELNTTETTIDILLDESTVVSGNIAIRAEFVEDGQTALDQIDNRQSIIDNRKSLRDGLLVIEKNGKFFNAIGAEVK